VTTIQTYVFRLLTVLEPQRAKGDPHASSPRHREAGTDWTCRQPPWMRRGSRWASLVVGWPSKPVTPPSQRRRWVRRCDYGEETCSPTLASSSRCCQWPNASVKCARRRSRTGRRRSSPWDVTRPWPRNSPRSRRRIHFESDSRRCAWWRCTDQVGEAMPRRCTETSPTGWPRSLACARARCSGHCTNAYSSRTRSWRARLHSVSTRWLVTGRNTAVAEPRCGGYASQKSWPCSAGMPR